MAAISSVGVSAAVTASIVNSAEQDTAVAAKLLKIATDADKNLVNTLLPTTGAANGGINIRA